MVYEWWFGWEIMEKWEKHEIFYAYFSLETVLGTWCPEKNMPNWKSYFYITFLDIYFAIFY